MLLLLATWPSLSRAEQADRNKPVNIEADRMVANDSKKTTDFDGRVILTQGTLRITADHMTVHQDQDGFKQASAYGNPVTFRQKRDGVDEWVDGVAQRMEYNERLDRVELFDKAMVHRDKDQIRGDYLSYNTRTEFLQAHGNGSGSTPQTPQSHGRVHVTLQPANKDNAKTGKPAPLPYPSQTLQSAPELTP